MANQSETAQELLLDVRVADASRWYKFYLNIWELTGNVFQWINPMFLTMPNLGRDETHSEGR